MKRATDMNNSMRVTGVFGLALIIFVAFASYGSALAQTEVMGTATDVCSRAKLLIDRAATVILNQPPAEAFDAVVKGVLAEICSLRRSSEATPELQSSVDNLAVTILGWAWSVSTLIKFKAERNSLAADIAAQEVKRKVTAIQTICPALVMPNVGSLP
jgi:hypothetical protein